MDNKPDAPDKYKVKLDYEIPKLKPKIIGGKMLLPEKEERLTIKSQALKIKNVLKIRRP